MKRFWKILATGIFLALPWLGVASAQQVNPYCTQSTAPPYIWAPCSPVNALAVTASVSASITGFPGASPTTGTPISVTTGGVTGSLPAGAVVVASNVGATNGAYCKLGASSTTSDQLIPPNSWFAFTVGAATQLTCITSTSTTTVNMVGGSGLPTGSGGGGGGSGGGAITAASGSYASGALASGSVASGAMVDLGAQADAAAAADNSTASLIALLKRNNQNLTTLNTTAGAAVAAGTSRIGYVSDDPCTQKVKLNAPIATSSGNVQLVAPSGSTKVYICSLFVVGATAFVGNIIEGTGAACTTANEAAIIGSTTAASGVSLAANNGWVAGNGGATAGVTATAANGVCLLQSGTAALAGNMTYVQQ